MSCWGSGDWDAEILVGRTTTEIELRQSREVLGWCWDNHLPMVSGKDRRAWVYNGVPLPERGSYGEQLASKELYDRQAKQSCLGY
jgi:hypothetical protein